MTDEILVDDASHGDRLDRFLTARLKDHSRAAIQRWIKDGRVTIDGETVIKPSTKLDPGQRVSADPAPPRPTTIEPEPIPLSVIHEDELICVIDKPSGLTVHPGAGRSGGTLANALVHRFRNLSLIAGADRPGIVHRLDRDTSGVLVVARTEAAHHHLSNQFAERTVAKEYVALVDGLIELDSDWIELPLARDPRSRERMSVNPDGRHATTFYRVEKRFAKHTLVRLFPRTGRTHQLRVHLRALGNPIVADPFYGHSGNPTIEARRLALHAEVLTIDHPGDGSRRRFTAPIPEDLAAIVRRCDS
jgi:23S rRNA pseudouridine1911/1915/1917 synthase